MSKAAERSIGVRTETFPESEQEVSHLQCEGSSHLQCEGSSHLQFEGEQPQCHGSSHLQREGEQPQCHGSSGRRTGKDEGGWCLTSGC